MSRKRQRNPVNGANNTMVQPPAEPRWKQWCVDAELDEVHAVNDEGDSMEYIILTNMGIRFRAGMKIVHRNGNTMDNRRANLSIVLVE